MDATGDISINSSTGNLMLYGHSDVKESVNNGDILLDSAQLLLNVPLIKINW